MTGEKVKIYFSNEEKHKKNKTQKIKYSPSV
jgi:hypothetical protein